MENILNKNLNINEILLLYNKINLIGNKSENIKFPYNILCEQKLISTGKSIKIKPIYEKDYNMILNFYKALIESKSKKSSNKPNKFGNKKSFNGDNKNRKNDESDKDDDKKNIQGGNNNNIIQIYSL